MQPQVKEFKTITLAERKAILIGTIIKRTKGYLNKQQIEKIVNNMDLTQQYRIGVYETPKKFSEKAMNKDIQIMCSNISKNKRLSQNCRVILGDVELGKVVDRTIMFGETVSEKKSDSQIANFSISEVAAIEITTDDSTKTKIQKELAIYLPESQNYEMDKEIEVIIKIFDIFNK